MKSNANHVTFTISFCHSGWLIYEIFENIIKMCISREICCAQAIADKEKYI